MPYIYSEYEAIFSIAVITTEPAIQYSFCFGIIQARILSGRDIECLSFIYISFACSRNNCYSVFFGACTSPGRHAIMRLRLVYYQPTGYPIFAFCRSNHFSSGWKYDFIALASMDRWPVSTSKASCHGLLLPISNIALRLISKTVFLSSHIYEQPNRVITQPFCVSRFGVKCY